MSDKDKPGEDQVNIEELKAKIAELENSKTQLEGTNKRLLDESKEHKSKYSEYKTKLDAFEKDQIDKDGDIQKKLDYEKNRNKFLEEDAKSKAQLLLDQNIRNALSRVAGDALDLEDIITLKKNEIKAGVDKDSLSVNEDHLKTIVTDLKTSKPWMFKTPATESVDTNKPNTKGTQEVNIESASFDDLKASLRNQIIKS